MMTSGIAAREASTTRLETATIDAAYDSDTNREMARKCGYCS
jgi:hypothetical protein